MRKTVVGVLAGLSMLAAAPAAQAITRSDAKVITAQEGHRLACYNNGWTCDITVVDVNGPFGGSIQWVGHFYIVRTGFGKDQGCHGSVDIGPYGGVYNPTIRCQDGRAKAPPTRHLTTERINSVPDASSACFSACNVRSVATNYPA